MHILGSRAPNVGHGDRGYPNGDFPQLAVFGLFLSIIGLAPLAILVMFFPVFVLIYIAAVWCFLLDIVALVASIASLIGEPRGRLISILAIGIAIFPWICSYISAS
jgi:hypothetical protein